MPITHQVRRFVLGFGLGVALAFGGCGSDGEPSESSPESSSMQSDLQSKLGAKVSPVADRSGWYVLDEPVGDWEKAERRALELHDRITDPRIQIVCGALGYENHRIYVITDASPLDLIRLFDVGSHNVGHASAVPAAIDRVVVQMTKVEAVAPFRPYFADAAGYKCRFIHPADLATCRRLEDILLIGVGMEGYESEVVGDEPRGEIFAPMFFAEQGISLWWD